MNPKNEGPSRRQVSGLPFAGIVASIFGITTPNETVSAQQAQPDINNNPNPVEVEDESKIYNNINCAKFFEILTRNPNSIIFDARYHETTPGSIPTEQSDFKLVTSNRVVRYFLGEPTQTDSFSVPSAHFYITQPNSLALTDKEFTDKITQRSGEPKINLDTEIVVVCHSGIRSKAVTAKLKTLGFTNVKMLWGGFSAIRNQGSPELKKLISQN
jgi:rhodanese-related sulfurtransferase